MFQVAAVASIVAALYMRIFLKDDTTRDIDALKQPILNPGSETTQLPAETGLVIKKIPLPGDIIRLLRIRYVVGSSNLLHLFFSFIYIYIEVSIQIHHATQF